jgi:hypothetical protein
MEKVQEIVGGKMKKHPEGDRDARGFSGGVSWWSSGRNSRD